MDSVLLEDNPHWVKSTNEVYNDYTHRELLEKALAYMRAKEMVAIIGARRVGKSSLTKLMIKALLHDVNPKNIFFINLEKPSFIPFKHDPTYLEKIYDTYLKLANPNMDEKIYFFIDEIQIFDSWEVFIKSKYENSNIKFVITGSNASLLASSYATLLTGRVLKLELSSFNFREFLNYKNIAYGSALDIAQNRIAIKRAVDEYLKWGGYYSVFSNPNEQVKIGILKNIAEDIILKDIVPRYSIKNSEAIRDLFFYVLSNATTQVNYSRLAKKIGIDAKMIKEYIGYFQDNFLVKMIPNYHTKLTQQIKSVKKLYVTDNGFLNLGVNRSENRGTMLENMVFTALNQEKLHYLLDGKECDFYLNGKLYQVSYDIEDEVTRKREFEGLKFFADKLGKDRGYLVTYDSSEVVEYKGVGVEVLSLDGFLVRI
ncbi:ATP-binding protein [bacterium]|nr:ATP-binding protein [bacterium]MBU1959392.1 ATP-binding protein [bacterium]